MVSVNLDLYSTKRRRMDCCSRSLLPGSVCLQG